LDSLTQIILGAAVGEAVLGRKIGNKAMLYGAIAGTIPDLDVFSSFFTDTVTALETHRGFTHSIFFSVLLDLCNPSDIRCADHLGNSAVLAFRPSIGF
jgi:inner membrane protein